MYLFYDGSQFSAADTINCTITSPAAIERDALDWRKEDDLVRDIPGYVRPSHAPSLESKLYSGFVDIGDGKNLHYTFVEKLDSTEDTTTNKPKKLGLWLNGGPGSSSLLGFFTELGPLSLSDKSLSKSEISPQFNNYTWNKLLPIIYLESPAGVGFSRCSSGTCPNPSDDSVAGDNYAFLEKWLDKFPDYRDAELYLLGESYGGVYLPTLAGRILDGDLKLKLKKMAIGNPSHECKGACAWPSTVDSPEKIHVDFFYGHGFVSPDLYSKIQRACTFEPNVPLKGTCKALYDEMHTALGGYNTYNVYDDCKGKNDTLQLLQDNLNGYPCGSETVLPNYLNLKEVREAFNLPPLSEFPVWPGKHSYTSYNRTCTDTVALVQRAVAKDVAVLIYSGDVDSCIPLLGTWQWIDAAFSSSKKSIWRPWTIDGGAQMGGYTQSYEDGKLVYATVRAAGHEVPRFQPSKAFALIQHFFNDEALPRYRSLALN